MTKAEFLSVTMVDRSLFPYTAKYRKGLRVITVEYRLIQVHGISPGGHGFSGYRADTQPIK